MKISEVIEKLKEIEDQHGDLDVETAEGLVDSVDAEGTEGGHMWVLIM